MSTLKTTALVGALDVHPDVGQKTLRISSSAQEVEHVFKAVSKISAFCLKTHEGLTQQFDFVIHQWRKEIGPGTQVILVITTDCLKALWVRDATCVIHYGFPTSPKRFGSSLFCMSEKFRNLSDKHGENTTPAKSILLITEMDARHMVGVRYLKRSDALLPPELLSFAEGVMLAKEQQKTDRPLCNYLKSFGVCRDSDVCPDRHWFSSTTDQSLLPDSGTITVLPLYIKTASVFYGRIVKNQDDAYESLASTMVSYYATEKLVVKEVVEGGLYGMEEKVYQRSVVMGTTILVETIVIGAFYFLLRCDGFEVTQPPQVSVSGYGSASIRCEVTALSANQQVDDVRLNRVQDHQGAVLCQRGQGSDCVDSVWYQESTSCHVFVLLRLDGKELQGDRYECEVTTRQDQPRLLYETRKGRPTRLIPPGPTTPVPEIQEVTSSSPLPVPSPSSSSVTAPPLPVLTWILIGLLAVMSLYSGSVTFMYIRLRVTRGEELYDRLTYMPMVRGHLPLNSTYEDMRPHPQRGLPPISSPSG